MRNRIPIKTKAQIAKRHPLSLPFIASIMSLLFLLTACQNPPAATATTAAAAGTERALETDASTEKATENARGKSTEALSDKATQPSSPATPFITYDMLLRKHSPLAVSYQPPVLMSYQRRKNTDETHVQSLTKALNGGAKTEKTVADLDAAGLEDAQSETIAIDVFALEEEKEKLFATLVLYKDPLALRYTLRNDDTDFKASVYEISDSDQITKILRSLRLHLDQAWPPVAADEEIAGMYLGYHKYVGSDFMPQLYLAPEGNYNLALGHDQVERGSYAIDTNSWATQVILTPSESGRSWALALGSGGILINQEERLDALPFGGQFEKIN